MTSGKGKPAADPMRWQSRHNRMFRFAKRFILPLLGRRFNLAAAPAPSIDGPYLVLANHNLDLDPALIHLSFSHMIYFVASEHVLRGGLGAWFLKRYFAPIPRLKGSTDIATVKGVLRRLKHGVAVCIFAEGNRSFDGVTGPIPLSIAKLAKACRVPVLTYRFEGGYLTAPRWSQTFRRGRMKAYPVSLYDPAAVAAMSVDELDARIRADLHEDAYARQQVERVAFHGKRLANGLETTLYYCPACHALGSLRSEGDKLRCSCGMTATYDVYGSLSGSAYETVRDWDAAQRRALALRWANAGSDVPLFADANVTLKTVTREGKTAVLTNGARLAMHRDRIDCAATRFDLTDISDMAIVGRNRLLFTAGGQHYEWSGDECFCGRKYLDAYRLSKEGT